MPRIARAEDAKQIAELYAELDQVHWEGVPGLFRRVTLEERQGMISYELEEENVRYIVSDTAGEVAGFAKLVIVRIPEDHPLMVPATMLHIEEMAVKEGREGEGTRLIAFAEEVGRELGATVMTLQVLGLNEEAKSFFWTNGYSQVFAGMSKVLT